MIIDGPACRWNQATSSHARLSWHGHVHPGGGEPVVWMDGLDVPFVLGLRAGFIRDDPYSGDPLPVRDTTGTAAGTAALVPAGTRHGQHSPVRRYPWDQAYPALRRLMARSPGRNTLTSLEYRNPLTGGPALAPWAACSGLPAARTQPRRDLKLGHRGGPRHRTNLPASARCCLTTWRPSHLDLASAGRERPRLVLSGSRPPHPTTPSRPVPGRGRRRDSMNGISVNGTELEYRPPEPAPGTRVTHPLGRGRDMGRAAPGPAALVGRCGCSAITGRPPAAVAAGA
jgi:hypothetical protein